MVSCVENDQTLYNQLKETLSSYPNASLLYSEPCIRLGKFHEHIDEILEQDIYSQPGRVATFAFVDPCGISGVRLCDLVRLVNLSYGECLLFFNYSGVNRWIGAAEAGELEATGLIDLLGTELTVTIAL